MDSLAETRTHSAAQSYRHWRILAPHVVLAMVLLGVTPLIIAMASFWYVRDLRSTEHSAAAPVFTYQTPVGVSSTYHLPDGSALKSNTHTKVVANITAGSRQVTLVYGEAQFQVARDAARPFIVSTKGLTAQAIGTEFTVRRIDDGPVEVIVTEGQVRVSRSNGSPPCLSGAESIRVLSTGQIGTFEKSCLSVRTLSTAELRTELSWTTGQLIFENMPLSSVIAELSRYSRRRVVIVDPELAARRVHATTPLSQSANLLRTLLVTFGARTLPPSGESPNEDRVVGPQWQPQP